MILSEIRHRQWKPPGILKRRKAKIAMTTQETAHTFSAAAFLHAKQRESPICPFLFQRKADKENGLLQPEQSLSVYALGGVTVAPIGDWDSSGATTPDPPSIRLRGAVWGSGVPCLEEVIAF